MTKFDEVKALIEDQRAGLTEEESVWCVGEQLLDMAKKDEHAAGLLAEDLKNGSMGIIAAEAKIKAWADAHRNGRKACCVTPGTADRILREFYGIGETRVEEEKKLIDLSDFF